MIHRSVNKFNEIENDQETKPRKQCTVLTEEILNNIGYSLENSTSPCVTRVSELLLLFRLINKDVLLLKLNVYIVFFKITPPLVECTSYSVPAISRTHEAGHSLSGP